MYVEDGNNFNLVWSYRSARVVKIKHSAFPRLGIQTVRTSIYYTRIYITLHILIFCLKFEVLNLSKISIQIYELFDDIKS